LESRKYLEDKLSPFSAWSKAISSWLEIDHNRSSNQQRNDKLFLYLGNKAPFPGFVKIEGASSISQLATFTGVVNDNGTEINITIHSFQSDKGGYVETVSFYLSHYLCCENVTFHCPNCLADIQVESIV
jgi:hypothetical protein